MPSLLRLLVNSDRQTDTLPLSTIGAVIAMLVNRYLMRLPLNSWPNVNKRKGWAIRTSIFEGLFGIFLIHFYFKRDFNDKLAIADSQPKRASFIKIIFNKLFVIPIPRLKPFEIIWNDGQETTG